jgi:hypothetical protein
METVLGAGAAGSLAGATSGDGERDISEAEAALCEVVPEGGGAGSPVLTLSAMTMLATARHPPPMVHFSGRLSLIRSVPITDAIRWFSLVFSFLILSLRERIFEDHAVDGGGVGWSILTSVWFEVCASGRFPRVRL